MSIQRINELIALPWPDFAAMLAEHANAQVNCVVSDDWHLDIKHKYHSGPLTIEYRMQMRIDSGDFTSSISSPPGYESLSHDHLLGAAPLHGTWSGGVVAGFTSHFQAWINGHLVVDASPYLTQSLEIYGLRATADIRLDTTEPARPRLQEAKVMFTMGLEMNGPITKSIAPVTLGAEFDPPDTFRLLVPLDVTTPTPMSPLGDMPKVGFVGFLELTLSPRLAVGYDGAFKVIFYDGEYLPGQHVKIEASVPFKFRVNLGVPGLPLHGLLSNVNVPRDWGEHPPAVLQNTPLPPQAFDFLTPALEVEEAVLPTNALQAPDDETIGPYHAPHGLIYEIQYHCTGPSSYPASHHLPPVDWPPPPSDRPQYETYNDTAIWTGHFLAAESFRHAAAPSSETLERVRFIVDGIRILFEVTGVPGLPARAALKAGSTYNTDPPMCSTVQTHGTPCKPGRLEEYYPPIGAEQWCGFGRGEFPPSRDSYIGLTWGMACAFVLVQDAQVHKIIIELVTEMLENLAVKNRWNVHTPPHQPIKTTFLHEFCAQLALLRLGKTVNPQVFGGLYDHFAEASDFCWIPEWGGTWDPISKYFGLNLSHGALGTLLFLEDNAKLRRNYKFAFAMIRRTVRHHRNPYFNLVRVMTELAPDRDAALHEQAGFAPHMTLAEETRLLLQEWLIRRHCIPGPRGLPTERSPDPDFLVHLLDPHSPNRAVPYTPVGSPHPNNDLVTRFALPVQKRRGADFLWQQSPFNTDLVKCGGAVIVKAGSPELEAPGIDYLLPFWMAAFLGIVPAQP